MSSGLMEKINNDLKSALKSKSTVVLSTLRLLKSDMQYEMSRDGSDAMSDEQVEALIKRAIKRRKDAISQYETAGKSENVRAETQEMEILQNYLPESMNEEAIKALVEEVYTAISPAGPQDMGKMMGAVMGKLKGQNADGSLVKNIVLNKLKG